MHEYALSSLEPRAIEQPLPRSQSSSRKAGFSPKIELIDASFLATQQVQTVYGPLLTHRLANTDTERCRKTLRFVLGVSF